jgi:hypothetical protein
MSAARPGWSELASDEPQALPSVSKKQEAIVAWALAEVVIVFLFH